MADFIVRRTHYALLLGAALYVGMLVLAALDHGTGRFLVGHIGWDFAAFDAAGELVHEGRDGAIYDAPSVRPVEQAISNDYVDYTPFISPPWFAAPFAGVSRLPFFLAFVVFSLAGLAALRASMTLLEVERPWRAAAYVASSYAVFLCLQAGQTSLLSLLLLSAAFRWSQDGRGVPAGLAVGAHLFKPHLVAGVVLFWLFEWRKNARALVTAALTAAATIAATVHFMPEATHAYVRMSATVLDWLHQPGIPREYSQTLRAFWDLLLPAHRRAVDVLTVAFTLAGVFAAAVFWRRHRAEQALGFAIAVMLGVWVAPHLVVYDWTVLAIPLVLFWKRSPSPRVVLVCAALFVTTYASTLLAKLQLTVLPVAVQISIPVLAWAAWSLAKESRA